MAKHLADYILLWAGGGGDDLAKSPHMARISNSVYDGICPGDPTCRMFGFVDNQMTPTPMMQASMLFRLHNHNVKQNKADPKLWEDVFRSRFGKVRIFRVRNVDKESKKWVANPDNRICDAPGSWYAHVMSAGCPTHPLVLLACLLHHLPHCVVRLVYIL